MARLLTESTLARIAEARALYPRAQSALLPALHLAQDQVGYLPPDAMEDVADALGLTPPSRSRVGRERTTTMLFFSGSRGTPQDPGCARTCPAT